MPPPASHPTLACLLCALLSAPLLTPARAADPAPGPSWGQPPAAPASTNPADAAWTGGFNIVIKSNQTFVALGPPGCPIAVIGEEVWNLKTGGKTGITIPTQAEKRDPFALSTDGQILAVASNKYSRHRDSTTDVTVWDTATGHKICEIPSAERDADLDYIGLSTTQYLLISARSNGNRPSVLEVWDAKTAKRVRRFPFDFYAPATTSVSPDGRYIATGNAQIIQIYDLTSGQSVAHMPLPSANQPVSPKNPVGPPTTQPAMTSIVPFISMTQLEFSPDGRALAAYCTNPPRILCWDNKATLTDDVSFHLDNSFPSVEGSPFQWSPDSKAWLVEQHALVQRDSGRLVWTCPIAFADYVRSSFLDPQRILMIHSHPTPASEILPVPLDNIKKSLAAATNNKETPILRPGSAISIEIQCENLRGNESATKQALLNTITQRLQQDGISVADNQPTVLTLRFEEGVGDRLHVYQRPAPFDFHLKDTGRTVIEARALLHLQLHLRGQTKTLFADTLALRSCPTPNETTTDADVRQDLLRCADLDIARTLLPYFLSANPDISPLPLGLKPHDLPKNFLKKDTPDAGPPPVPPISTDPKHPVQGI